MRWVIITVLVACSSKPDPIRPTPGDTTKCGLIKSHVEQLYRAEAQAKEPKRVDEATADNTAMVLRDCRRAPDRVASCVNAAASVAELEQRCLIPLDDEGTEGMELRK
jgi:hypothetical protein